MARRLYNPDVILVDGGSSDAYLAPDSPVTIWDDAFSGNDVTADMRAPDGISVASLVADGVGVIGYLRGPDGYDGVLYRDTGIGTRFPMYPLDKIDQLVTGDEALRTVRINGQVGVSYTLELDDAGALVTLTNAAAVQVTVPDNSSVSFTTGTQIHLLQLGVGQVTVVGDSGVTVSGTPGLRLADQYSAASLLLISTNNWVLVGRLTT